MSSTVSSIEKTPSILSSPIETQNQYYERRVYEFTHGIGSACISPKPLNRTIRDVSNLPSTASPSQSTHKIKFVKLESNKAS